MDQGINPSFKPAARKLYSADELFLPLREGVKSALSTAITYIESNDETQNSIGKELLEKCFPYSGKSKRIGVTGVPGAGKSTFIEAIGKEIIKQGGKVAVLAIDPTSTLNKGSILGDKTRMEELSVLPKAFVRPTPSGTELGGVARNTFEAIILCEAAGYDHILVETVGVGQSEIEVKNLTDIFVLLAISGAGDELQGIKRGIMEMADLILVNKADGNNKTKANEAVKEIRNAVSILSKSAHWTPRVYAISALGNDQINESLNSINQYFESIELNNRLNTMRTQHQFHFFNRLLRIQLSQMVIQKFGLKEEIDRIENQILNGKISGFEALDRIISMIKLS